jgi:anti-sigma regulatory factor (Ser/Thr protein kinase)
MKLARSLDEDVLSDLQTVATELVTNSFRHAGLQPGDRIELLIRVSKHGVRLEVTDPGPGFQPGPVPADPLAPGGRGLLIIRRLSERWGVKVSPGGCSVWCDIPVEGRVQHLAV